MKDLKVASSIRDSIHSVNSCFCRILFASGYRMLGHKTLCMDNAGLSAAEGMPLLIFLCINIVPVLMFIHYSYSAL